MPASTATDDPCTDGIRMVIVRGTGFGRRVFVVMVVETIVKLAHAAYFVQ